MQGNGKGRLVSKRGHRSISGIKIYFQFNIFQMKYELVFNLFIFYTCHVGTGYAKDILVYSRFPDGLRIVYHRNCEIFEFYFFRRV